ncbi:unnamed protein product [Rangifer tarandus platyrhynchus]|uniref:Uncharacterized protein n=1 Tax=Rangifer tarandus platyrhynchus TaxID=3082113 RepID=A0AC59ZHY7_RANTA
MQLMMLSVRLSFRLPNSPEKTSEDCSQVAMRSVRAGPPSGPLSSECDGVRSPSGGNSRHCTASVPWTPAS